jgi:hypothetical protein
MAKAAITRETARIAPTEYMHRKAALKFSAYRENQAVAMLLVDPKTGEKLLTATVNLPVKPAEGCVWLKTWSENQGVVDNLIKAGVISLTGAVAHTGHAVALEGRLLV